jgi:hypothetical protein
MPVYKRKKMCSECPFRACAPRGWLGPMTVDDVEQFVHGMKVAPNCFVGDMGDMICHTDTAKLADKGKTPDQILAQGQQCVGMIRYANSVMKLSKNPAVREFQEAVAKVPDQPTIERFKLREHHDVAGIVAAKSAKKKTRTASRSS